MKAIIFNKYGASDVLREEDVAVPVISDDEVLVEMYTTSVNPVDCYIRSGQLQEMFPLELPHILGTDIAGIVQATGKNVENVQPGDRVFGLVNSGSYAAYARVDKSAVVPISSGISFVEAGALPAVSITAWQSLFHYGKLRKGERILIHAAAGGVGHIAIQLAKWAGAYVIGTASSPNHDFVRQLGADEVIDYTAVDFTDVVHNVDLVIDAIGGEVEEKSFKVLKEGGKLISLINPAITGSASENNVEAKFALIQPRSSDFAQIEELVREHKLKVHISGIVPLSQVGVAEAHRRCETRHVKGKVVIQIRK
ncbi:NADP-dependent oxidoreductase [Paenibacillus agri]|uniref:NADP-dependent oxidoreductase n=1 Tax=Paenibacillus agri TaxID=2744309 RepID=A0A850ERT5_9BACL|nr:NADP-dependent oxidoreductase [Paenibacillus agri]NUU61944.1 NADP-dependent oxidoreductase [Paenibacillus agri]